MIYVHIRCDLWVTDCWPVYKSIAITSQSFLSTYTCRISSKIIWKYKHHLSYFNSHWTNRVWTDNRWNQVRVKSGKFGHQVNSKIHLQMVEIQIRIFTVCLVNLSFNLIIKIWIKQDRCPNYPDVRSYLTLPYLSISFYSKPLYTTNS